MTRICLTAYNTLICFANFTVNLVALHKIIYMVDFGIFTYTNVCEYFIVSYYHQAKIPSATNSRLSEDTKL